MVAGLHVLVQGILNRTECTIHVFDPTLTPHQKAVVDSVPGLILHEYGLGDKDGWVSTGGDKSMTLGKNFDGFHVKSLPTIMKVLPYDCLECCCLLTRKFEGTAACVCVCLCVRACACDKGGGEEGSASHRYGWR